MSMIAIVMTPENSPMGEPHPTDFSPPAALDAPIAAPSGTIPSYAPEPPPEPSRTNWLFRGGAMAIVVALAATSMILLRGSGDVGGAESPEGALAAFLGAVADEDIIGAAEAITPEEREAVFAPTFKIVDELQRLGILAERLDLGRVDGFDIEFENLQYQTKSLGSGVSSVAVLGDYEVSTSGEFPIGEVLEGLAGDDSMTIEPVTESGDVDFELVVVQRDGKWFVSFFYTLAELARTEAGLPAPDFGNGVTPVGAASPEGAVEAMVEAAIALDAEAAVAQLSPAEMAVMYDYAPLLLERAEAAAEKIRQEEDFFAELDHFAATSDVDGDRATVRLDAIAMRLSGGGEAVTLDTRADCVVQVEGASTCEVTQSDYREQLNEAEEWGDLLGIRTVEIDGRWYISPLDTGFSVVLNLMASIEREDVERVVDTGLAPLLGFLFAEAVFSEIGEIGDIDGFGNAGATSRFEMVAPAIGTEPTVAAEDAAPPMDFGDMQVMTYFAARTIPAGTRLSDAVDDGSLVAIETSMAEADPDRYWSDRLFGDEVLNESVGQDWVRWDQVSFSSGVGEEVVAEEAEPAAPASDTKSGTIAAPATANEDAGRTGAEQESESSDNAESSPTTSVFVLGPIGA